jgi:hypothetical protein
MLRNNYYKIFWNITEHRGYYTLHKEIDNPLSRIPAFMTASDAFVGVFRAFEVVEARETLHNPNILSQVENVKDEDNPILAFYYVLKK